MASGSMSADGDGHGAVSGNYGAVCGEGNVFGDDSDSDDVAPLPLRDGEEWSEDDDEEEWSDDEDDDDFQNGVDTPSKFQKLASRRAMQKRKMGTSRVARKTELEWASFGASDAGLGEELLGMNEFAGDVEAGALSFLASIGKSSVTSEQLRKVTEALFGGGDAHVSAGENSEAGLSSGGHADGAGEPLRAQPAARAAVYKETAAAAVPFASRMPPPQLQPETRDASVRGAETRDAYVREGGAIVAAIPPAWPAAGDDYLTSKEPQGHVQTVCQTTGRDAAV